MKAIEVTGKIDQQGNLVLDEPIRDYAIALCFERLVWECDRGWVEECDRIWFGKF